MKRDGCAAAVAVSTSRQRPIPGNAKILETRAARGRDRRFSSDV
jgi:hypothetical protein